MIYYTLKTHLRLSKLILLSAHLLSLLSLRKSAINSARAVPWGSLLKSFKPLMSTIDTFKSRIMQLFHMQFSSRGTAKTKDFYLPGWWLLQVKSASNSVNTSKKLPLFVMWDYYGNWQRKRNILIMQAAITMQNTGITASNQHLWSVMGNVDYA